MATINLASLPFNWWFLIELLIIVIVITFYIFFFNRALGSFVAFILRIVLWRSRNAYFECESLQISPVGGRILFKDLRYTSRNQSLRIFKGHITWRYWKLHVRDESNLKKDDRRLPCRITVECSGVEWFLYNRTPIYDTVLEHFLGRNPQICKQSTEESSKNAAETAIDMVHSASRNLKRSSQTNNNNNNNSNKDEPQQQNKIDWLKEALPIEFHAKTGSIVLGNRSSHCVLIAGFDNVSGTYGAVESRSSLDLYKHIFQFNFLHPKLVWRTNPDYEGGTTEYGQIVTDELLKAENSNDSDKASSTSSSRLSTATLPRYLSYLPFAKLLKNNASLFKSILSLSLQSPPPEVWQGLSRYKIDDHTIGIKQHPVEYAKVLTLLDSPELDLTYYVDNPGVVPHDPQPLSGTAGLENIDIGNGDLSPEWGIDLAIKGGTIYYGPWADRQRMEIQKIFFPPDFTDAEHPPKLEPGDYRVHVALKMFVEFTESTTFRIPTREPSKDWRYETPDELSDLDLTTRPYGWLNLELGANSNLSYFSPSVPTKDSYESLLEVHADSLTLSSSVNYVQCLEADACRISCLMSAPLRWDATREWTFNLGLHHVNAHLLRDHITLMIDFIEDWTTGPGADFDQYVPFSYHLNYTLDDYHLNFYLNDHNIINNPTTWDDNALLTLSGPALTGDLKIPQREYKPDCYTLEYSAIANDLHLAVSLPGWNTHGSFATENTKQFGHADKFSFSGSQFRYSTVSPNNVESMDFHIDTSGLVFKMFGWAIRHFMNFRDNYFGNFCHFLTLEEYRFRHRHSHQGDPIEKKYRPEKMNDLQVTVTWNMQDGLLFLPQEIYDCKSAAVAKIPELNVVFRLHDYLMELNLNIDPIDITYTDDVKNFVQQPNTIQWDKHNTLYVEGLDITGHRLFGPQPRTSAYVCIWDIGLGNIHGNTSIPFLQTLDRCITVFGANYVDHDNALPSEYAIATDPDVTLVSVTCDRIDMTIWGSSDCAASLKLKDGFSIYADDIATKSFKDHVEVDVPDIQLGLYLLSRSSSEVDGNGLQNSIWAEVGILTTDIHVVVAQSFTGWEDQANRQLHFIQSQDYLTQRCPFLYGQESTHKSSVVIRKGGLVIPTLEVPRALPVRDELSSFEDENIYIDSRSEVDDLSGGNYDKWNEQVIRNYVPDDGSFAEAQSDDNASTISDSNELQQRARDLLGSYAEVLRFAKADSEFLPKFAGKPLYSNNVKRKLSSLHERLETLSGNVSDERRISEKCTRIHIASRHGISIFVVPSILRIIGTLQSSISQGSYLDQWIDAIFLKYTKRRSSKSNFRYTTLQFGLSLPQVNFQCYHHTSPATAPRTSRKYGKLAGSPVGGSLFSQVVLKTQNIELTFEQSLDHVSSNFLQTDFNTPVFRSINFLSSDASLEIFNAAQRLSGHTGVDQVVQLPGRNDSCVLSLQVPSTRGRFAIQSSGENSIDGSIIISSVNLSFVDTTAELVASATYCWVSDLNDYVAVTSRSVDDKEATCRLVANILRYSKEKDIKTDPTFLNRVSYLVQTTSTNLRSDGGWKILAHLRHCLRLMEPEDINATWDYMLDKDLNEQPEKLLGECISILSNWRTWEIDPSDIVNSDLLRSIYEHIHDEKDQVSSFAKLHDFTGRCTLVGSVGPFFTEYHCQNDCTNSLFFGPIKTMAILEAYSPKSAERNGNIDLEIDKIGVEMDSLIFSLISYVAQVRGLFERKIKTLQTSSSQGRRKSNQLVVSQPVSSQNSVSIIRSQNMLPNLNLSATVKIPRFDVSATTEGLQLVCSVINLSCTTNGILFPNPLPQSKSIDDFALLQGHCFIGFQQINTVISEQLLKQNSSSNELETSPILIIDLFSAKSLASFDFMTENNQDVSTFFLTLQESSIYIPRSLLRMFHLLEDWKYGAIPNSRLLFKELKRDLDANEQHDFLNVTQIRPPTSPTVESEFVSRLLKSRTCMDFTLSNIRLRTQALSTLVINYSLQNITINYVIEGPSSEREKSAGLRISEQKVEFLTKSIDKPNDTNGSSQEKQVIPLPRITIVGRYRDDEQVDVSVIIAAFKFHLSVSIIDNILAIQRRFGDDIDELLNLVSSQKWSQKEHSKKKKDTPRTPISVPSWDARIQLQGFKVMVDSPASVQYFEADSVSGSIGHHKDSLNNLDWEVVLHDLNLSVDQNPVHAQQSSDRKQQRRTNKKYRLAYFTVDVVVNNKPQPVAKLPSFESFKSSSSSMVNVRVPRLHAVMQGGAMDALAEMIDFYHEELRWRRETRAEEIMAIRHRIRQTLHFSDSSSPPEESQQPSTPWIETVTLSVLATSVGIAIPLQTEEIESVPMRPSNHHQHTRHTHPAFLTSISSMSFATSKGEAGFAEVNNISLQFIKAFDQGRSQHYEGHVHHSRNRLQFPSMQCIVHHTTKRNFRAESTVSGHEIDLEPNIAAYAFSLFDVFQAGKQRIEKLVAQDESFRLEEELLYAQENENVKVTPRYAQRSQLKGFEASFEFVKGSLRLHPYSETTSSSSRQNQKQRPSHHRKGFSFGDIRQALQSPNNDPTSSSSPEVFTIPGLTLWTKYVDASENPESEKSLLHVDATMHSSNNTLYPSVIPFFSSVASDIQKRMKRTSTNNETMKRTISSGSRSLSTVGNNDNDNKSNHIARSVSTGSRNVSGVSGSGVGNPGNNSNQSAVMESLQINVALRIDRSRLEVSCRPLAPVSASLSWQSGGFIFGLNLSKRDVSFVAMIDEIGIDLRHTFSPEKCIGSSAKGLTISVSMSPLERDNGLATFLSAAVTIPEISGEVTLRQLHDLLCLKVAWLDRLEELQSHYTETPATTTPHETPESELTPSQLMLSSARSDEGSRSGGDDIPLITAVLVQVKKLSFICNMGHSIGITTVLAENLAVAAHQVSEGTKSMSLSFNEIQVLSTGRLTGKIMIESSSFRSVLRTRKQFDQEGRKHLLGIALELGQHKGSVQYDYRKILLTESGFARIIVEDDWSKVLDPNDPKSELQLNFSVKLGTFSLIATTQTIPTIFKITKDLDRIIAERREKAKLVLNTSMDESLSSRSKTGQTVTSVAKTLMGSSNNETSQAIQMLYRLHIEAERIRLVIFTDSFTDAETSRVDAGKIKAELVREESDPIKIHRILNLHLGFLSVRKLRPRKVTLGEERKYEFAEWQELLKKASDRNIVRVPTTKVDMISDQVKNSSKIHHRFSLNFAGQVDMSLNYALLKTLGDLVTAYQNGMKRVQSNLDVGGSSTTGATAGMQDMPESNETSASASGADVPTRVIHNVPEASTSVVTMPRPALPLAEPGQPSELEFIALENVIEQPQLNLLGDATPPLEWLGVQRAKFPGWIHSGVTLTLEELLLLLSKTYKKQLARGPSS